jgi:hypothetical protein
MPEEHAFCCLVHFMHTYQFRSLYTPKMELLELRLYQFDHLVQELLPKIHDHLVNEGIRSTMYASQWFLTLFAYRFPLKLVYRILDIVFATGVVNGAPGSEGGLMDTLSRDFMESVAAVSGSFRVNEISSDTAIVLFRVAFSLLKKNENNVFSAYFLH